MKLEKDLAAAQVQAVIRGNSGRLSSGSGEPDDDGRSKDAREPAKSVTVEKDKELDEAAAQMQAVMRGRKARNEKKEMAKATTQVQAMMRGRAARSGSAFGATSRRAATRRMRCARSSPTWPAARAGSTSTTAARLLATRCRTAR